MLGCLLEKQLATPNVYPLTLNTLVAAANQTSNRDPIVTYGDADVSEALAGLREKGAARIVFGSGQRAEKYRHVLDDVWGLDEQHRAVLCVLMLRGPQTVGELRGRTERMHEFADMEEVERVLEALADREAQSLVARAARGRWAQLLGGPPQETADSPVAPAPVPTNSRLEERVSALERELAELRASMEAFRRQFE